MRLFAQKFSTPTRKIFQVLGFTCLAFLPSIVFGQNIAPTPGNESLAINEDQSPAMIGSLIVNNIDANGDPLSIITIFSSVPGTTITNLNNGFIQYYPLLNYCGIDQIIYFVSDGSAIIQDTLFLTINCINDAPTQGNETLTVNQDAPPTATPILLANNTDPEGSPISITSIGSPINGTLIDNGNGTYNYTPNLGYCGTETISYTVSDGVLSTSDQLTIIVICTNFIPNGGNESITILEDAAITNSGYLLGNDVDPNGNSLTILNVTQTGGGSFSMTPTGSINYTPNPNFCGTDTLVYSVTDGTYVIYDTLFVFVTCVNDLPTSGNEYIFTDSNIVVNNIIVLGNNVDIENGVLTITSPTFPATTAAGGTVTINPDNTLNYTPPLGFVGYDTLIYIVCDDWTPTAGCVTDTLFIAVSVDSDGDGVSDLIDIDSDNDGIRNTTEALTALNNGDTDNDGIIDILDRDSDSDGIMDIFEAGGVDSDMNGFVDGQVDINFNGMDDVLEVSALPLYNTDGDAQPDFQDVDDDGDSILTINEYDVNLDGILDDCNANGIPDYLDTESCDIMVPQVFSPNWDGKNDVLIINGIYSYKDNQLSIFNRWGTLVYKSTNYQNNWSGTNEQESIVKGTELPTGTYFYVLDLNDGTDPLKGYIYLTR